MKRYVNIPIASYDMSANYTSIPDEVMEKALDSFKNAPIVYDNNVIGVIENATHIDKKSKTVFGDASFYFEPCMAFQSDNIEHTDGINTINKLRILSVDLCRNN